MKTLSQIKIFIDKYKFFIISSLILVTLFLFISIRFFVKPHQATIVETTQDKTIPLRNQSAVFVYEGKKIPVPSQMNNFKVQQQSLTQETASQIALRLGFETSPNIISAPNSEVILLWNKNKESLTISLSTSTFAYENSEETIDPTTASLEKAILSTQNFLKKLEFSDKLNLTEPNKIFLADLEEGSQETDAKNAKYIQLKYSILVNSFPIILNGSEELEVESIIDSQNKIRKLKLTLPNFQTSPQQETPTKSFDQLLQEVKLGGGILLSSKGTLPRFTEDKTPSSTSVRITSARLEYLMESKSNTLVPVIAFRGQTELDNGQTENILIINPVAKNIQIIINKSP